MKTYIIYIIIFFVLEIITNMKVKNRIRSYTKFIKLTFRIIRVIRYIHLYNGGIRVEYTKDTCYDKGSNAQTYYISNKIEISLT